MNSLYKRIITLGMVSVAALLAWVYCIVTFPKQLVYLAVISLVVVVSLYALLNALMGLHIEKENKLQAYFKQVTNEVVEKALEAGDTEESIRLAKASYVQIRRSTTNLKSLLEQGEQYAASAKEHHDETCTLIADSINKATKIIVKYNGNNSGKLLETLDTLSSQVAELKLEMGTQQDEAGAGEDAIDYTEILSDILDKLDTLKINVVQGASAGNMVSGYDSVGEAEDEEYTEDYEYTEDEEYADDEDEDDDLVDAEDDEYTDEDLSDIEIFEEPVEELTVESNEDAPEADFADEIAEDLDTEPVAEETADLEMSDGVSQPESVEDDEDISEGMALAQGMIDAFLGGENGEQKVDKATEDPGKKLSADEIAAMFAASKEERKAESDDDFKVEDHPDAMDQGLIDALLSLDETEEEKAENESRLADVIPFPNTDSVTATPEPAAPAPVAEDPNKKLSADEIAALFAASTPSAPAPEPEPAAPAPAAEDPNKKLSADEIAALFAASTPSAPAPEPEPAAPAPVAEDPGRQLTPDEIAALFSSMSG
jgi:uncharacterized membrane-anchored protein YhcB (DUF1043 family)